MKVGIISDTHDNIHLVDKTIDRLNREKVELVLHAGDYVAPFTVVRFKHLRAKLIGVLGNNDGDHRLLAKRFADIEKAHLRRNFAEVTVDGVKIALLHGEDSELLQSLLKTGYYTVVVHGHSHEAKIYKKGKTTVINPGEVCGYLSGKSTIALLDTTTRKAEIIKL